MIPTKQGLRVNGFSIGLTKTRDRAINTELASSDLAKFDCNKRYDKLITGRQENKYKPKFYLLGAVFDDLERDN